MTELRTQLEALLAKHGYSEFFAEMKAMYRQRIKNADRPERIHLSPGKRRKLLDRYKGRCHICGELIDPFSKWHVDHINPHLSGDEYNDPRNLAPSHPKCNEEKNADSIMTHAKKTGQTARQILDVPEPDPNDI
jgi:5-methylcytosine-specific restriction endonuclease McrA